MRNPPRGPRGGYAGDALDEASSAIVRHDGFTAAAVAVADHERPGWWRAALAGTLPEPTATERRFRVRQLTVAARLIAEGRAVEPGWVRVNLLDLRDLLAHNPGAVDR